MKTPARSPAEQLAAEPHGEVLLGDHRIAGPVVAAVYQVYGSRGVGCSAGFALTSTVSSRPNRLSPSLMSIRRR